LAVNVGAIAALGAGVVLTWSGIENQKITVTLQDIVSGKKPQPGPMTPGASSSGGGSGGSSAPESPGQLSANEALGKTMAAAYGWTGSQWNALYALWMRESGWNSEALNSSSGAFGIPQALPASKMYGGTHSATLQIQWGLGYIAQRYGSPEGAWAHEEQYGWY
jgi:hypothetical protein